jgi:hypothetical protein
MNALSDDRGMFGNNELQSFINEHRYELGVFTQNYFNTGTQGALFFLATTVCWFVFIRSFRCGMKQTMSNLTGYNH